MVGPTDVVQPPVARDARARDAALWAVSSAGGARRCGCVAAGEPEFVNGLLGEPGQRRRRVQHAERGDEDDEAGE